MPLKSIMLFCATVIGFGIAFPLTNVAVSSIPSLWVATGRSSVALLVLGAFLLSSRRSFTAFKSLNAAHLCVGILTGVIPYILIAWGQTVITSSLGGVLFASTPLMTLFLGFLLFKMPFPKVSAIIGGLVGIVGVAVAFVGPTDFTDSSFHGAFATVLASASYAIGGLLLHRIRPPDIVAFSTIQLVPASFILLVISSCFSIVDLPNISMSSLVALLLLGFAGTAIPLVCLFVFIEREGAKTASVTTFFIPFVALAVGISVLGEPFLMTMLLGLFIMLAGTFLIS